MKNGRVVAEIGVEYKEKLQQLANKISNGNISELLRMVADKKDLKND